MASLAKIFGGVLLIASGIAIIYESNLYHLIEIVTIFGVILVIIGAYLLILSFFERNTSTNLQKFKNNLDKDSKVKKLGSGLESKNNPLTKDKNTKNTKNSGKKDGIATNLGNNLNNSKLASIDTKKITGKVKEVSKKDPKAILKPMVPKSNENTKKFRFTPNYEKPMKVNRRPQKRNKSIDIDKIGNINKNNDIDNKLINLNNVSGEKSERIARALASDDFIRPIHAEPKSTLNPNVSNDDELDLDSFKQNSINKDLQDNNQNTLITGNDFNDVNNDITTDDFENGDIGSEDVNYPVSESLDNKEASKFLSSYVVCSKGTMTSKEAFEELAKSAKSEILLEMASIKDMTNEFLSKISSLDVKVIIQEFDIKDMSYVLLITSLLEQGVKIRTLPLINTINLIADDSHALIISENESQDNIDIGAVYNDSKSVLNVKSMFEKSWNIANDLDINNIGKQFD